jgi:MFS family permease
MLVTAPRAAKGGPLKMRRFSPPAWLSLPLCLATMNFFSNTAYETSNVYLALYARSIGSSNLQVGYIAAAMGIALLVSSFIFGRLSDIHGRVKFIRAGLGLTPVSYVLQLLAYDPWTLLAARAFFGFCIGINFAVIMAYSYEQQRQIGNFIAYGALGWLVGAMLAAIFKEFEILFAVSAVIALIPFLLSFLLKEDRESATLIRVAAFPMRLIKENYRIYLAFFLRQLGGTAIWAIWPLYLSGIGASKIWISAMDATNMIGQFIAMRIVERFNPGKMFQAGLIISAIVFAIYGLATHYLQILPVQLLLSVGYSALFIGCLNYLLRRHPEHGTIAGLMNSTMSLSSGLGPFLGGAVSQVWGYAEVMYLGAGITLLGLLSSRGINSARAERESVSTLK